MKRLAAGCALLFVLGTANFAHCALIAEFNFDDLDGVADFLDAHVSSTDFLAGAGLVQDSFAGADAASRGWIAAANAPGAVGQAKYWEFTVTANPGYLLNLSSLTFDEFKGASGPANFQVQVNNILIGSPLTPTTTSVNHILDLSSFTGVTSANVRLIAWDSANNGVNSNWNVDNIELSGAAVPEPSALLLAVMLAPGYAAFGRRKRRE